MLEWIGQNPWTFYFSGLGLTVFLMFLYWFFDETANFDACGEDEVKGILFGLVLWPLAIILLLLCGIAYGLSTLRDRRFARIKKKREDAAKTEEQLKAEMEEFIEREQKHGKA